MDNRVNIAVIIGVVFVLAFAVTLTQSENQVKSQIVEDDTPSKVFSATTSELAKVEGLGEARAKKIKNMLTTKNKLQKESNQKTLT